MDFGVWMNFSYSNNVIYILIYNRYIYNFEFFNIYRVKSSQLLSHWLDHWPTTSTESMTSRVSQLWVYDNWKESYNIHVKDLQALQLFIPGTIVRIQTIPALDKSSQPIPNKVIFHQLFWSFKACIDAFVFCKPMVQIDGTWLYGRYKGILLIVVAQDVANNIFPLAFVIVESETTDDWHFFCKTWEPTSHHNMVYA